MRNFENMYSEKEFKERKRIVKFLRGSKERFKTIRNFDKNEKDFIDILFAALKFDEDETVLYAVTKACGEVREVLTPFINCDEIYKFLVIIEGIYSIKYTSVIERFYR